MTTCRRIATGPGAPAALEPWLDLRSTPIRYVPNQVNLNGIVASPDGRWLLTVQLATGQLWRVDTTTREVAQVQVDGGPLRNGDGLVLAGLGLALGLVAAYAATGLIRGLLVGVNPADPLAFAIVAVLVLAVALVALWSPAHAATRIDPATTIREA